MMQFLPVCVRVCVSVCECAHAVVLKAHNSNVDDFHLKMSCYSYGREKKSAWLVKPIHVIEQIQKCIIIRLKAWLFSKLMFWKYKRLIAFV